MCKRIIRYEDAVGKEFGKLTVLEIIGYLEGGHNKKWALCKCRCGNLHKTDAYNVIHGKSTSCGCNRKKKGAEHKGKWKGCGEISGRYWNALRHGSKSRDLSFEITIEQAWELFLKQDGKCALTGLPLTFARGYFEWEKNTASLDRKDCSKGYSISNVHWVHKDVNKMRMDFTIERFREICRLVTLHGDTLRKTT